MSQTNRERLEAEFTYKYGKSYLSPGRWLLLDERMPQIEGLAPLPTKTAGMLKGSALPERDREYVEYIVGVDPENKKLVSSVEALLEVASSAQGRRKITERHSQSQVDLEEVLKPYSGREQALLVENLGSLQLTEGCTVGCSFCGISALRSVGNAFSMASLDTFLTKNKSDVNTRSPLYYASDPFDWVDGNLSYMDIESLWSMRTKKIPYTSTAVPLGAEFSILQYLEYMYTLKDDLQDLGGSINSIFRISRYRRNSDRVDHMFEVLRQRGVDDGFLKDIEVNDLNDDDVVKSGYLIKHPQRDVIKDSVGIACFDGVVVSPQGVDARTIEVCTAQSYQGWDRWSVKPGSLVIPKYLHREPYYYSDGLPKSIDDSVQTEDPRLFALLPKVTVIESRGGVTQEREVDSMRREALMFSFAGRNLLDLVDYTDANFDFFKENPGITRSLMAQAQLRREQLLQRKDLLPSVAVHSKDKGDPEAIVIAGEHARMADELAEWFINMVADTQKRKTFFFGLS